MLTTDSLKNKKKDTNFDENINLNLFKVKKADDIINYFEIDQIVDVGFDEKEINYKYPKTLYDLINYLILASKLIKEEWKFRDYYKMLPSSKYDFYRERENEGIAKISFINEMQNLIDTLNSDNNYLFLGSFQKTYSFFCKEKKLDKHKFIKNINASYLKIVLSNNNDEKIKSKLKRVEKKYSNNIADNSKAQDEIEIIINEKKFLEEELFNEMMEERYEELFDVFVDDYHQQQADDAAMDSYKDERRGI